MMYRNLVMADSLDEIINKALHQIRPVLSVKNGTGLKGMNSAADLLKIDVLAWAESLVPEKYDTTMRGDGFEYDVGFNAAIDETLANIRRLK